jgi:hypothetical protein
MKPIPRIIFTLTAIVVVTGIIAFIKIHSSTGQLPISYFIPWAVVSVVLIGLSVWQWPKR